MALPESLLAEPDSRVTTISVSPGVHRLVAIFFFQVMLVREEICYQQPLYLFYTLT